MRDVKGKGMQINSRVWQPTGLTTAKGKAIYRSILGHYAVERDHKYFVASTAEEMREIEKQLTDKVNK